MTERDPSEDLQHVLQLAIGYMPAVALNIVVKLGIADLIDGGPVNTKELAKKIGVMRTVKTGESAMELAAGKPVFGFFRYDPEESKVFNAAMVNLTRTFVPAVLEVYDFSKIRKIVDVGGGHGSVVAAILARYPKMQGILSTSITSSQELSRCCQQPALTEGAR
jgi:O-methyltransferase domain